MAIIGCDLLNNCPENSLIPFVFSCRKNDPLFEIDDVESVKNMKFENSIDDSSDADNDDVKSENGEKKEGFLSKLLKFKF